MSETVHYKGTAFKVDVPVDKSLSQVVENILKDKNIEMDDYYDNVIDCLVDNCYREYFYYPETQTLYKLDNREIDPDRNIIDVRSDDINKVVDYELKYYNGTASFNECLREGFDILLDNHTFNMFSDLYGSYVQMDDRLESIHIWNKNLALENKGRWIPKLISKKAYEERRR